MKTEIKEVLIMGLICGFFVGIIIWFIIRVLISLGLGNSLYEFIFWMVLQLIYGWVGLLI